MKKLLIDIITKLEFREVQRIHRLPYWRAAMLGKYFDLAKFIKPTDDPLPKKFWWRRIEQPPLREDGTYMHGWTEIKLGNRFKTDQCLQKGDISTALKHYYRLPKWCFMLGRYDKVNKLIFYMSKDIEARNKRDSKKASKLTDEMKAAGFGELNFGHIGLLDWLARRNNLTYPQAESMSDLTYFALLNMDFETFEAKRRYDEIMIEKMRQDQKK